MRNRRNEYIICGVEMDVKWLDQRDVYESDFLERYPREGELKYFEFQSAYVSGGRSFVIGIPIYVSMDEDDYCNITHFSPFNPTFSDYVSRVQNHIQDTFGEYVEPHMIMVVEDLSE